MRLFSGKVPVIAQEVVQKLSADGDMECVDPNEVIKDIESVLIEYLRAERRVLDEAKNRMEARGVSYTDLHKLKGQAARDLRLPVGEDALPYLLEQVMEMLFPSSNADEVFAEDTTLRKKITQILRKHMDVEQELDREVRSKIKNLEEGTASFETEYARVMDQLKRNKKLT